MLLISCKVNNFPSKNLSVSVEIYGLSASISFSRFIWMFAFTPLFRCKFLFSKIWHYYFPHRFPPFFHMVINIGAWVDNILCFLGYMS